MKNILWTMVFSLLLAGCSTTVSLMIKNPTDIAQAPRVIVQDNKGIEKETINLGKLQPKGEIKREFKVSNNSNLLIKSSDNNGYDVCDFPPYSIPAKPDPYPLAVDLCIKPIYLPDDSQGPAAIGASLSKLGEYVGFTPLPIKNGLSTWFGALIVYVPPSDNSHELKLLYKIQPSRFLEKEVTLDEFQYPSTISSQETQVTGKSSAGLALSVPVYGSLGVDTNSENLYNIKWSMEGFGSVGIKEPAGWSLANAIKSLPENDKKIIFKALKVEGATLMFVNRIYVIKNADFSVKEGKKLSTNSKLNAMTFLTANGAWSFESANEAHKKYQELVLNISGMELNTIISEEKERNPVKSAGRHIKKSEDVKYTVEKVAIVPGKEIFLTGAIQKY
jgi:hypothetical protein